MKSAILRPLVAICILGLSAGVHAQSQISYSYAEVLYQGSSFDVADGDTDGNGVRAAGSIEFGKYFHGFGSYEYNSVDDFSIDDGLGGTINVSPGNVDIWAIGAGIHTPISGDTNKYRGRDRYSWFFEGAFKSFDGNDGYAFDLGFRAVNFTALEIIGSIGMEDYEDLDEEFTVKGRALFTVTDSWQFQAGADWNDLVTKYYAGFRYNFSGLFK